MTVLFFMWGFMTVFNDMLIPRFKEAFTLSYFQAMLVQFAFFGAYGIGSLLYFVVSVTSGDPIAEIGYKNGVIIGLLIAAAGSALFYPAARHFLSPVPGGALHRRPGLCDVTDCRQSLCNNPRSGTYGVESVESVASL